MLQQPGNAERGRVSGTRALSLTVQMERASVKSSGLIEAGARERTERTCKHEKAQSGPLSGKGGLSAPECAKGWVCLS